MATCDIDPAKCPDAGNKDTHCSLRDKYHNAVHSASLNLSVGDLLRNKLLKNCDKDWPKKAKKHQRTVHITNARHNEQQKMKNLVDEYNRNTDAQGAAYRMQQATDYAAQMQATVADSREVQLRNINVDLMTSKRVASLYTEASVRLQNECAYLRSFVVALCVSIIVMVLCITKVISFPVATAIVGAVAVVLVIVLIMSAVQNANRYRMLYPEREWPLHTDMSKEDEDDCGCDPPRSV